MQKLIKMNVDAVANIYINKNQITVKFILLNFTRTHLLKSTNSNKVAGKIEIYLQFSELSYHRTNVF